MAECAFTLAAVPYPASLIEKLERRIEYDPNTGCWLWSGNQLRRGYGGLTIRRRTVQTHRLFFAAHVADPGPAWVLHRCDTPACCNPAHLFLGDNRTNVADRVAKGRSSGGARHGERHWKARLTQSDIDAIRAADAQGESRLALCQRYRIGESHLSNIIRMKRWKP